MPTRTANAMLPKVCLFALMLTCIAPGLLADREAATVIRSKNQAEAVRGDQTRSLNRKDAVFAGEQVQTGNASLVSMRFTDGSVVTLDASTELNILDYQYQEGGSPSDSLVLELASGSFRSLTGAISKVNPKAYTVKTPVASLSIRGTLYMADVDPISKELAVFVWEGRVVMENEFGSVSLGAGEGAVTQEGQPPVRSDALNNLSNLTPGQLGPEFAAAIEEEVNDSQSAAESQEQETTTGNEDGNEEAPQQQVPQAPIPEDDGSGTGDDLSAEDVEFPEDEEEAFEDAGDAGFEGDIDENGPSGRVYAPGLGDEGQEIGADKIIGN